MQAGLRVKNSERINKERDIMIEQIPESKFDDKRTQVIDDLVSRNVFKVDGRQLYELSLYELLKEHTDESLES